MQKTLRVQKTKFHWCPKRRRGSERSQQSPVLAAGLRGRPARSGHGWPRKGLEWCGPGESSGIQMENWLPRVRTFFSLQGKAQKASAPRGAQAAVGSTAGSTAGASGPSAGGAPPGGETLTHAAQQGGGLRAAAFPGPCTGAAGPAFLGPEPLGEGVVAGAGRALGAGTPDRPWAPAGGACSPARGDLGSGWWSAAFGGG